MNTTVPTRPPSASSTPDTRRDARRPDEILRHRAPRTSLLDRIAMRVGLALLVWGTRPEQQPVASQAPDRPDPRELATLRRETEAQLARETLRYGVPSSFFVR
ncbi:hypothetical protein [Microbacterium sp. gxy059]|uniref:hypothetical protein n=1 Tax=Microbacterium sp. gxy059 TaxID=2957199 RepID=UPI003D9850E6